jgi:hypothetical protein
MFCVILTDRQQKPRRGRRKTPRALVKLFLIEQIATTRFPMNKYLIAIAILFWPSCVLDGSVPEINEELRFPEQAPALGVAEHCAIATLATPKSEPLPDGRSPEAIPPAAIPRCFPSFSEAIEFATDGRVELPRAGTVDDLDNTFLNDVDPGTNANNVIGIEYEHSNFAGSSLIFYNEFTCRTHTMLVSSMPSGWNDRISSARAYADCARSEHYEHNDFGGSMFDCHSECSYIGNAMNDRTSSIRWF